MAQEVRLCFLESLATGGRFVGVFSLAGPWLKVLSQCERGTCQLRVDVLAGRSNPGTWVLWVAGLRFQL